MSDEEDVVEIPASAAERLVALNPGIPRSVLAFLFVNVDMKLGLGDLIQLRSHLDDEINRRVKGLRLVRIPPVPFEQHLEPDTPPC